MANKTMRVLLFLIIAATLTGCNFRKSDNGMPGQKQITLDEQQESSAKIKTQPVEEKILNLTITIPAQFKAINKFLDLFYAPADGIVTDIFVVPGDIVKIGQPLIRIKSDAIGLIQLQFLNEYIVIDSNIKQMHAMYNLSKQMYRRENTLYREGISSRAEYEVAYAQMLKDGANLNSLIIQKHTLVKVYAQRVALYGGSENTIRRAVSTKKIYPYIELRSHKNGVVLSRKVNPGEVVGQNKELLDVADLSKIWLVGYAFEKDAPLLKIGQKVKGIFEDTHTETATKVHKDVVEGHLSYVASMLDTEKKTMEVIADIPNKNYLLKPNMYAEMIVDIGKKKAVAVPNSAILKYGDYNFAYVKIAPHVYEERKIEIGQHNDSFTEIKSGVSAGEEVVSSGGFSLLGESIKEQKE